jgi:hypothetical protein
MSIRRGVARKFSRRRQPKFLYEKKLAGGGGVDFEVSSQKS